MDAANAHGNRDYLNAALIGTLSTIFVGALDRNGSLARPASLADYSNFAGSDPIVQNQFLVIGVEGHKTGLYGTSFAAPVISGYRSGCGSGAAAAHDRRPQAGCGAAAFCGASRWRSWRARSA